LPKKDSSAPPHPASRGSTLSAISGSLYLNKAQADAEHHSLSEEQILWKVIETIRQAEKDGNLVYQSYG
jgi:hypothetical protein